MPGLDAIARCPCRLSDCTFCDYFPLLHAWTLQGHKLLLSDVPHLVNSGDAVQSIRCCHRHSSLCVRSCPSFYTHNAHMQMDLVKAQADALHLSNMITEPWKIRPSCNATVMGLGASLLILLLLLLLLLLAF